MSLEHWVVDELDSRRGLLQGDILYWSSPIEGTLKYQLGVVVTADCDIAQNKTHGFISYLPLIDLEQYIALFWGPAKLREFKRLFAAQIENTINRINLKRDPSASRIPEQLCVDWLGEAGANGAIEQLEIPKKEADQLLEMRARIIAIDNCPKRFFGEIRTALINTWPGKKSNSKQAMAAAIVAHLTKELPTAIQVITGHEIQEVRGAHVVLLGFVRSTPIDHVTTIASTAAFEQNHAIRIARLTEYAKFKTMERFGLHFTRIGVPENLETSLMSALSQCCTSLCEDYKDD